MPLNQYPGFGDCKKIKSCDVNYNFNIFLLDHQKINYSSGFDVPIKEIQKRWLGSQKLTEKAYLPGIGVNHDH